MASMFSFRSGSSSSRAQVAGVDIGSRTIKLVVLEAAEEPVVAAMRDAPTPPQVFPEGQGFSSPTAAKALERLGTGLPLPKIQAAVLLPPAALRTRRVQLGVSEPDQVRRALVMDPALRVTGAAPEMLHHAFHILDTPETASGSSRLVLAAAARQDAIRAHQRALESAGLIPARVGAGVVALAALQRALHPEETGPGSRVVVIHGGYSRTEIVVLDAGVPVFSHQVLVGTEQVVERARRLAPEQATGAIEDLLKTDSDQVRGVLAEIAARMQQEVRTTLGAAAREVGGSAEPAMIDRVRITGGLAGFPLLAAELSEKLGTDVLTLDPASRFSLPSSGGEPPFGPAYALAFGAALEAHAARGAPGGFGLDLSLPMEGRKKAGSGVAGAKELVRDRSVLVSAGIAALLLIALPQGMGARLEAREAEQGERRSQLAADGARLAEVRRKTAALEAEQQRLSGALGSLDQLEARRDRWMRFMDVAAARLPEHAWIESLEMDAATGTESAVRLYGVAPSLDHVNRYERALGQDSLIVRTTLSQSEPVEVAGISMVRFTISGVLRCKDSGAGYTVVEAPVTPAAEEGARP